MPTTRPRHVVTESDVVAQALDDAAEAWPEERDHRAKLLVRLLQEGHRAVLAQREHTTQERRRAIEGTSGALSGLYGEGYLEGLRRAWPA